MADSAAHLVDEVLPQQPIRQWVLSVPFPMRLLFATYPDVMSKVLGIVYRAIATHVGKKSWIYPQDSTNRGSHADPAFWFGAESQYTLSHAVFGRCVY